MNIPKFQGLRDDCRCIAIDGCTSRQRSGTFRRDHCAGAMNLHMMGCSAFLSWAMPMNSSTVAVTRLVTLIAPRVAHAKLWFAWRAEVQAQRFMPIEPWSVNALKQRLMASTPDLADQDKQEHRWIVQVGAEIAGIVSILRPVYRQGHAEISYHLAEAHQGRGIGTEAVTQLVNYVFDQTDLVRLFALISVENRASRKLVEKLGFVHEGTLRSHFVINGKRVDQCVYGLLEKEWKRRR
jgi:ribosomal-protein-alanine N-acetyltransferase